MKKITSKLTPSLSLLMLSGAVVAHEGHGSSTPMIHNLEHSLLLIGAITVLCVATLIYRKLKRKSLDVYR